MGGILFGTESFGYSVSYLDSQANSSQYFLGAEGYLAFLNKPETKTIVDMFEQFSVPSTLSGAPTLVDPEDVIVSLNEWDDSSLLYLIASSLELSWTLKNPTEKAQLLPKFIANIEADYDLIIIDCAPTESILTTAAYRSSRYVFVPVKPEFLATIGLPLLARSFSEFMLRHQDRKIEIAGIIFNDMRRSNTPPEQVMSCREVEAIAEDHGWPVFKNPAHHSDSYAAGSRAGTPIFSTSYARDYVVGEFQKVAEEFLKVVGLK